MKAASLRGIITWLIDHLTDTQMNGIENIPPSGGILICTNHMSRLDIPVLFTTPNRPKITALVTTKYLKYPLLRWFIVTAEGIWLDRDIADFGAIRKAMENWMKGMQWVYHPKGLAAPPVNCWKVNQVRRCWRCALRCPWFLWL